MGIVRRRKVDVAADIPARRVADLPVELDDEAGRSIRAAERELARRLVSRYEGALERRTAGRSVDGIDHELVRRVATWEREDTTTTDSGENVFSMMRRIGQAKAGLAADYAAQLARNVGKVVFFAKHVDVMDEAEETFAKRGIRYASIRGDQTPSARQKNIDAFVDDPDVAVVVCSLTAAGVGLNLQVASNVVLAELSWTDAEQTQAIDRVHRIGQGEPVTAWRIIAAQTIDTRIAELIDSKAGLAARALDGSDEEVSSSADVQLEALVGAADRRPGGRRLARPVPVDSRAGVVGAVGPPAYGGGHGIHAPDPQRQPCGGRPTRHRRDGRAGGTAARGPDGRRVGAVRARLPGAGRPGHRLGQVRGLLGRDRRPPLRGRRPHPGRLAAAVADARPGRGGRQRGPERGHPELLEHRRVVPRRGCAAVR